MRTIARGVLVLALVLVLVLALVLVLVLLLVLVLVLVLVLALVLVLVLLHKLTTCSEPSPQRGDIGAATVARSMAYSHAPHANANALTEPSKQYASCERVMRSCRNCLKESPHRTPKRPMRSGGASCASK